MFLRLVRVVVWDLFTLIRPCIIDLIALELPA